MLLVLGLLGALLGTLLGRCSPQTRFQVFSAPLHPDWPALGFHWSRHLDGCLAQCGLALVWVPTLSGQSFTKGPVNSGSNRMWGIGPPHR